jgi:hypothetical protein
MTPKDPIFWNITPGSLVKFNDIPKENIASIITVEE